MAQSRHYHISGSSNAGGQFGDTTYTKIFVGGLAWETQRNTMSRYFEQFGKIQEAVVITDKNTGRSKGYGFVTFKDPESAKRACQDPNPVIDGRRANCNLAILGASSSRSRTTLPPQHGLSLGHGRYRQVMGSTPPSYHGGTSAIAAATTGYFQHPAQYTFPYSLYGYSGGYSHPENMYPLNYYNISGTGQNPLPPYFPGPTSGPGTFYNFYNPYYDHFAQSNNTSNVGIGNGFYGLQHPQMLQYSGYTPQQYITGILSIPPSIPAATGASLPVVTIGPSLPSNSTSAAAVAAATQQNPTVTGHDHRQKDSVLGHSD